ncbi:MAG: inositol monophosphatase family protein, partial [Gemmataceae bacterium]
MKTEWRSRYEMAMDAARKGGDLAKSYFESGFEVEWKPDNSPVTIADKSAEELIRAEIKRHFPQDGFLGEEYGEEPSSSGFRWIIDPIDGTRSFVRRIPLWGTLVGLEYNGEQIAGIAYVPMMNTMYRALLGDGAYRDSRRI